MMLYLTIIFITAVLKCKEMLSIMFHLIGFRLLVAEEGPFPASFREAVVVADAEADGADPTQEVAEALDKQNPDFFPDKITKINNCVSKTKMFPFFHRHCMLYDFDLCISEIKAIVYSLTKKMHYLLNVYT